MDDQDQLDPGMDQAGSMYATPAQQAHAQAMSSFMSALDAQRDHAAMAAYRTNSLQPGAKFMGASAGAPASMARAALLGGPRAMLMSAMRHPPRLPQMHAGGPAMKQAPLPGASAGEKAAAFLHGLAQLKSAQRLGQGERPASPPPGAMVHSMDPSTSAHNV